MTPPRTWFITGASRGFGRIWAEAALARGDRVAATGRDPLPLDDPGVIRDLKKVLGGEKLSPVLVAEGDIADGYHRVCASYHTDENTDIPVVLVTVSRPR